MTLEEDFFLLFKGLNRAHGRFSITKTNAIKNGKQEGRAETIREPVTIELWREHLEGKVGIGIIPITDQASIWFGVIDIDINDIDHVELEKLITKAELPLIVVRSKSGGAHLVLVCKEQVPAKLGRDKLTEWATLLGYSGVEVFPKQVKLASDDDVGNWINMPYFGGDATERYAISNGKKLSASKFIKLAKMMAVTEEQLNAIKIAEPEGFEDAPPCIQVLCSKGFPQGCRNNGLYNMGVYARLRYGDLWKDHLDEYNHQFMSPPLGSKEVLTLEKSLDKKNYFYMCNEMPIKEHCNKKLCVLRKYGIGSDDEEARLPILGTLVRRLTDPTTWIVDVDGYRIEMDTTDLLNNHKFIVCCIEKTGKFPPRISQKRWDKIIREKMETAEIQEAPIDATPEGQFKIHLEQFCTSRYQGNVLEDLLRGKPVAEKGRHYFRSQDLMEYLDRKRFRGFNERKCWSVLREMGGHKQFQLKGKCVQCWWVPEFDKQDEEFDIPQLPQEEF